MLAAEKGRHPASYGNRPMRQFEEVYYFFYGTLMDPSTLGKVLKCPDTPDVNEATIEAHRIKFWGEYVALVIGFPEQTIHGVACKIKSEEEADGLAGWLRMRPQCTELMVVLFVSRTNRPYLGGLSFGTLMNLF